MTELATIADRSTLIFVRRLPGPIERVWAYLTDPKLLAQWFSGGIVTDRVGGDVRFEIGATGRVTAYQPPTLLEYTWNEEEASCGPVAGALVRWELAEDGSDVRLTLTHLRLPKRNSRSRRRLAYVPRTSVRVHRRPRSATDRRAIRTVEGRIRAARAVCTFQTLRRLNDVH